MEILWGFLSIPRVLFLWIDTIAFSLIDNVYDIFMIFAENKIFSDDAVKTLINNIYVLVGVFAFFKLAMLLINSIIDPDKLLEKKQGLSSIFGRTVLMLVLLVISPLIFDELYEIQNYIISENVIVKTILGGGGNNIAASKNSKYFSDAGKTMQKIVITTLIKPEDEFFTEGEAGVQDYLNNKSIKDNCEDSIADCKNATDAVKDYVDTSICKKNCQKAMAQYHQMINQTSKGGFKLRRLMGYIMGSAEVPVEGSNNDSEDVYYYEYIAIVTTIIFLCTSIPQQRS